jgi:hypothetical protein
MWLVNLYRKFRKPPEVPAKPQPVAELTPRLQCLDTVEKLNPDVFSLYEVDSGQAVFVRPQFDNIELYAEKLREAAVLIERNRPIRNDWVPKEGQRISVDAFLVSKEGYYLDYFKAVGRFKEAAEAFCKVMERTDDVSYGVQEHNGRMLYKLVVNVKEVSEALNEVAEMN